MKWLKPWSIAFASLDDANKSGGPTTVVKELARKPERYIQRGFALKYAIFGDAIFERLPIPEVRVRTLTDRILQASVPPFLHSLGNKFPQLAGSVVKAGCQFMIGKRSRYMKMADLSDVDIINFHDIYSAFAYFKQNRKQKDQKYLLTMHSDGSFWEGLFLSFAPYLERSKKLMDYILEIERTAITGCDLVSLVSEGARRNLLRFYSSDEKLAEKTVVLKNGRDFLLELPQDTAGLKEKKFPGWGNKTIILCVAGLVPAKGVDFAVQALRILHEELRQKNTALAFATGGQDHMKPELQRLCREWNLVSDIRFLGKRSDISELLLACDIVVQPSRLEAFPLSLIEGMAAGRPIVATNVGGIPELIEDGVTGLLVRPDPQEIAQGITALINDGDLAKMLGQAARAKYLADYTTALMIDRYLDLFTSLVGGG
jgi:glycosyltransferase involved in cell wall biosynthesis